MSKVHTYHVAAVSKRQRCPCGPMTSHAHSVYVYVHAKARKVGACCPDCAASFYTECVDWADPDRVIFKVRNASHVETKVMAALHIA